MREPTRRATSILVLAAAGCAFAVPSIASAQNTCSDDAGTTAPMNYGMSDDHFPGSDATGVPTDALIRIRYVGTVPSGAFIVQDASNQAAPVAISGQQNVVPAASVHEHAEIHFRADQPLRANTRYRVTYPELASGASFNTFAFTTGAQPAGSMPPAFEGLTRDPTYERNQSRDQCGDPEAATITLRWARASSPWPLTDIEYVVYETRGPGIAGPVERARQRGQAFNSTCNSTGDEQCVAFRLSSQNAADPVCFNIQALDAYGRADGNSEERCVNPAIGNYFVGCSVRPAHPGSDPSRQWVFALAGAAAIFVQVCARRLLRSSRMKRARARFEA